MTSDMMRTERLSAPRVIKFWDLFDALVVTASERAQGFGGCVSSRFEVRTDGGKTSKLSPTELRHAAALLTGDLREAAAHFRPPSSDVSASSSNDRSVHLYLERGYNDERGWTITFSVSGMSDNEVTGFTANLKSALTQTVEALTPPAQQPSSLAPALSPRRRVAIAKETTFNSVRMPFYGLQQIEEELSAYAQVGVEGEGFDGVRSTSDLAGLAFKKTPSFTIYASPEGTRWSGARVVFGDSITIAYCDSDDPAARSAYSRVCDILRAYSKSRRQRFRAVCGIVGAIGLALALGLFVGSGAVSHGHQANWLTPATLTAEAIGYLGYFGFIFSTLYARPKVDIGASQPGWWRRNRDAVLIAAAFMLLGTVIAVILAHVGVRH